MTNGAEPKEHHQDSGVIYVDNLDTSLVNGMKN